MGGASYTMQLELQVIVSHLMRILGTAPRSSARAVNALDQSPLPSPLPPCIHSRGNIL